MAAICDYCGEFKPCRKEHTNTYGKGEHYEWKGYRLEEYNMVCKECDRANAIIRENQKKAEAIWKKKQQNNWIKKRDKILHNGKR